MAAAVGNNTTCMKLIATCLERRCAAQGCGAFVYIQHPRIHPGHRRQGSTHAVCSGAAHERRGCTSLFAALLFEPLPLQQPAHRHHIHSIIASQLQCLLVRHCGTKMAMQAHKCAHLTQPRSGCSCVHRAFHKSDSRTNTHVHYGIPQNTSALQPL